MDGNHDQTKTSQKQFCQSIRINVNNPKHNNEIKISFEMWKLKGSKP